MVSRLAPEVRLQTKQRGLPKTLQRSSSLLRIAVISQRRCKRKRGMQKTRSYVFDESSCLMPTCDGRLGPKCEKPRVQNTNTVAITNNNARINTRALSAAVAGSVV